MIRLAYLRPTVTTVVGHYVDLATVITRDNHRVKTNAAEHVIAVIGNLCDMRYEDPGARKDTLHLSLKNGLVVENFDRKQALGEPLVDTFE
ncbi:hypothetical protein D3C85_1621620 [compost metagenome]